MRKIEMVDLRTQYAAIKGEIEREIQEVLDTAAFIRGAKVSRFQENLERYLGVRHVIPVGSGTDALQIALMALGLKRGDEVIIPTFTFVSAVEVVALLGLTPVLVDVDSDTFNVGAAALERAITPKTRAVVPVHLFGQNAHMEPILQLAQKHNVYVVEDACQSIGSTYTFSDGTKRQSGCMGDIGCTSFFPSKNLGCYGDGGAIFTDNDSLAAKIRAIANHGMEERYYHGCVGVNSRLDTIQAAILDVKLKRLDHYIAQRQAAAHFYNSAFAPNSELAVPVCHPYTTHVFHQYTLQLSPHVNRIGLQGYLSDRQIPTMVYYPMPLHMQKAYRHLPCANNSFPVAERLARSVLSLPMHTELDREQLAYIAQTVNDFFHKETSCNKHFSLKA